MGISLLEMVTWCFGHLLEQVPPEVYNERFKKWRLEDLPIVPSKWELAPRKDATEQLSIIRRLLKNATTIVNAGAPDREGQLLVDEVIDYLQVPSQLLTRALRLLVSVLNVDAVKQALATMKPNSDFQGLSQSALARSRADWLYGMNMTQYSDRTTLRPIRVRPAQEICAIAELDAAMKHHTVLAIARN